MTERRTPDVRKQAVPLDARRYELATAIEQS
jgi:hypothetical protein